MQREEILSFLKNNKSKLQKDYKVKKIGIFGSSARGENRQSSDIDIVVSMPSNFDDYYDLKEFLENSLNSEIDLALEKNLREFVRRKIQDEIIYV